MARIRGEAKKAYHQSKLDRLVTGQGTDPLECFCEYKKNNMTILRHEFGSDVANGVTALQEVASKKNWMRRSIPAQMTMKEKVALIIRTEWQVNQKFGDVGSFVLFPKDAKAINNRTLNGAQKLVKIKDRMYGIGSNYFDFINLNRDFRINLQSESLRILCNYSQTNVEISQVFGFSEWDIRNAEPCSQERYGRIRRFRKEMWAFLRGGDIPNGKLL